MYVPTDENVTNLSDGLDAYDVVLAVPVHVTIAGPVMVTCPCSHEPKTADRRQHNKRQKHHHALIRLTNTHTYKSALISGILVFTRGRR